MHRLLTQTVTVVIALAFGLGLAFGFQQVVDGDSATRVPAANVRGALARALGDTGPVDATITPSAADAVVPDVDPPSEPAPTPDDAVRQFLDLEVAGSYAASYGLLSVADRVREASRASWAADHADLPEIRGYDLGSITPRAEGVDVAVQLALRPEVTPGEGVVAGRASATFRAVAEDGGWRVAFGDSALEPEYPPPSRAPTAVRGGRARQACHRAPEYTGGLIGAAIRADALCGTDGAIRTGPVRALPENEQDQPFLAAFGSEVHDWARVVPVVRPVPMDVVVAPFGERWLVVGVLQEPEGRS